jgi:hypothetical protein
MDPKVIVTTDGLAKAALVPGSCSPIFWYFCRKNYWVFDWKRISLFPQHSGLSKLARLLSGGKFHSITATVIRLIRWSLTYLATSCWMLLSSLSHHSMQQDKNRFLERVFPTHHYSWRSHTTIRNTTHHTILISRVVGLRVSSLMAKVVCRRWLADQFKLGNTYLVL